MPGHPILTEEFDLLRSRQRGIAAHLRRSLPTSFLPDDEIVESLNVQPGFDALEAEAALRAVADSWLQRHSEYLDEVQRREQQQLTMGILGRSGVGRGWPAAAADRLLNSLPEGSSPPERDRARDKQLSEALLLLVMADQLAEEVSKPS